MKVSTQFIHFLSNFYKVFPEYRVMDVSITHSHRLIVRADGVDIDLYRRGELRGTVPAILW